MFQRDHVPSKGEEELEEAQFGISILGGVFSDSYTFDLPEDAGAMN
jgi:16S rRNA (guanine527-N7)-methyltransferase